MYYGGRMLNHSLLQLQNNNNEAEKAQLMMQNKADSYGVSKHSEVYLSQLLSEQFM